MSKGCHIFFCGGAKPSLESEVQGTELNIHGNIRFEIARFLNRLVTNLSDHIMDLLDIAAYVYVADQVTSRGGGSFRQNGIDWQRNLEFYIAVRDPAFWQRPPILKALVDALEFVSGDRYTFNFIKQQNPEPIQRYFELVGPPPNGFQPDTVMLFSGGLDSLAGAIEEGLIHDRKVALVTHCPTSKLKSSQLDLFVDLQKRFPDRFHQFPVTINKIDLPAKEYTQRTRSFLFSVLAFSVSSAFGLNQIKFFENGIVSINLPIAEQVVGSRASRTTHPKTLHLFQCLFQKIKEANFTIEAPFLYHTKTEIVQIIKANNRSYAGRS